MAAVAFGELVETAMRGLGMTQARLAYELARHTDGKYLLNETGIRRIREGRRQLDPELVGALVDVLELDPAQAWPAAGLWPPDLDVEGYRQFRHLASAAGPGQDVRVKRSWRALPGPRTAAITVHPATVDRRSRVTVAA